MATDILEDIIALQVILVFDKWVAPIFFSGW